MELDYKYRWMGSIGKFPKHIVDMIDTPYFRGQADYVKSDLELLALVYVMTVDKVVLSYKWITVREHLCRAGEVTEHEYSYGTFDIEENQLIKFTCLKLMEVFPKNISLKQMLWTMYTGKLNNIQCRVFHIRDVEALVNEVAPKLNQEQQSLIRMSQYIINMFQKF